MHMYRKLAVVGGGSALWTPDAVAKMALSSSLREVEVVLYDVNVERARHVAEVCTGMLARGYADASIRVTVEADLDAALTGAEVVMTTYCNFGSGVEGRLNALAGKYGSTQSCYTAGPGAMLYIALQAPIMLQVVAAMQRCCPDAYLINCSNPLPALVMVAVQAGWSPRKALGFCGALHWERRELSNYLHVAPERLAFRIGGTNHCTFFTEVYVDGQDASDQMRARAEADPYFDLGCWGRSTTEIEVYKAVGYLPCGGHASDIFPTIHGEWVAPGPEAPPKPSNFGAGFLTRLEAYARGAAVELALPAEAEVPFTWLDALAGAGAAHVSINLTNGGAVPNLDDWMVPDLECVLDARGVSPLAGPPLPEPIAEVVRRHQRTFHLAAQAAVTGDRALLRAALQLCPYGDYLQSADAILDDARAEFGEGFVF